MLGKLLLRSVTNDLAGSMLGGLGRAAAFGAGAVLVSELVNSATGRQVIPAGNYVPQQNIPNTSGYSSNQGTTIANVALARIAVQCKIGFYIAKADGVISPEEQMDLDYMCSSLMNNPNASASFRSELTKITSDRSQNFMNVEKYLDKLDVNTLSTLQADMQRVAELSDGVTENERKAMAVFQNYLYGKQGFPVPFDKLRDRGGNSHP